jgi:hypothetical protein
MTPGPTTPLKKAFAENWYGLFPVVAAWYSVLNVAAVNLRASGHIQEVWPALFFATIIGALGWLLSGLVTREPDRRTVISIAFVAWFAAYGALARPLVENGASPRVALAFTAALLIAFSLVIRYLGTPVGSIARLVRATVVIVVVFPLFSLASVLLQGPAATPAVAASPDVGRISVAADAPNIFLIVLDKYSGSASLIENYGFDNSGFEEQLRSRGFVVPREARSNYPHTWMSLASMLNWTFIDEIYQDAHTTPVQGLNAAIEDNRTWRFLKAQGYEFVFLPSTFVSTQSNSFADRQIPEPERQGVNVLAIWFVSSAAYGLPRALGGRAWLPGRRFPYPVESAAQFEAKFETLAQLAVEPGARFVFAHLLLPHEPYVFDKNCRHLEPFWPPTDYVDDQTPIREAYIAQIRCLNSKLDELVDRILESSRVPPIILLQSDHGHGMMALDPMRGDQLPLDQLDLAQVAERTSVFAAYHLPGDGSAALYESITPVNLLPAIFNHFFDADIPLKEDAIYWARLHPPFRLTRID